MCFCLSGECAPTLFKSSESKPTISNKQNTSHRTSQNLTPRGPTPLATSVFERIILQKGHITFYNPRWVRKRNETSERIVYILVCTSTYLYVLLPYPRAITAAPSWCGLDAVPNIDGRIHQEKDFFTEKDLETAAQTAGVSMETRNLFLNNLLLEHDQLGIRMQPQT